MKLYATISSERASKGQGGNELLIKITDKARRELWLLEVTDRGEYFHLKGWNEEERKMFSSSVSKGEKQKGEHCPKCGKKLIPSETPGYKWQCLKCDEDFYGIEAR